jgi:uncharacterized protein DUF4136
MRAVHCLGVAVALWMGACAHPVSLDASQLLDAASTSYVTFFLLDRRVSGDAAIDQRIRIAVESALADRGFVKTSPEEAQAVVVLHVATQAQRSRALFYDGWGGWQWRPATGDSPGLIDTYKAGTLVVDIFDAWTKQLIWSTQVDKGGSNGNSHAITTAINRMLGTVRGPATALVDRRPAPRPADVFERGMRIIFAESPAVLIRIDGEPRYDAVADTDLERIANSSALILRDESGMHYLRLGEVWLESYDLMGRWTLAGLVPDGADAVLEPQASRRQAESRSTKPRSGPTPTVFISTTPAELIVTNGRPEYVAVEGTPLLHLKNTTATVYREPTDQQLYVRVATGWFRAWTTEGPWEAVSAGDLPADLASQGDRADRVSGD